MGRNWEREREREYLEVVRTGMGRSERKRGNAGGGAGGSCGWKGVWVGERDWRKTWFLVFFWSRKGYFWGNRFVGTFETRRNKGKIWRSFEKFSGTKLSFGLGWWVSWEFWTAVIHVETQKSDADLVFREKKKNLENCSDKKKTSTTEKVRRENLMVEFHIL